MKVRQPAVAGQFYDADAAQLEANILALLEDNRETAEEAPKVLISPHAGYRYSGAVAASAWGQLLEHPPETQRVVMFGPAHRVALEGMALPTAERDAYIYFGRISREKGLRTLLEAQAMWEQGYADGADHPHRLAQEDLDLDPDQLGQAPHDQSRIPWPVSFRRIPMCGSRFAATPIPPAAMTTT